MNQTRENIADPQGVRTKGSSPEVLSLYLGMNSLLDQDIQSRALVHVVSKRKGCIHLFGLSYFLKEYL